MVWPEARTGIVKASENDFEDRDVVIASIQTLAREKRLKQVAGQDFDLCIIDEAHHSCSRTYRDTISYLGFMDDDPNRLLLGVTATTKRLDKMGLRNVFQKIVYESSLRTMVKAGYLSDIRGFRTKPTPKQDPLPVAIPDPVPPMPIVAPDAELISRDLKYLNGIGEDLTGWSLWKRIKQGKEHRFALDAGGAVRWEKVYLMQVDKEGKL